MNDKDPASTPGARSREPWNKGKLTGPKPPRRSQPCLVDTDEIAD